MIFAQGGGARDFHRFFHQRIVSLLQIYLHRIGADALVKGAVG